MTETPTVTPNEIRNTQFSSALRGYKREEVNELLQGAADALEDALGITADYRRRFTLLRDKYDKLSTMERTLKSTLLEAKKTADAIIESAEQEAARIQEMARERQSVIENKAEEHVNRMQARIEELSQMRVVYRDELRQMIAGHLKTIEEMQLESPDSESMESEPTEINYIDSDETAESEDAHERRQGDTNYDDVTRTWETIAGSDRPESQPVAERAGLESPAATGEPDKNPQNTPNAFQETLQLLRSAREEEHPSAPTLTESESDAAKSESVSGQIARAVDQAHQDVTEAPSHSYSDAVTDSPVDAPVDTATGADSETVTDCAAPFPGDPQNGGAPEEDTLYKKLAREEESQRSMEEAPDNAGANGAQTDAETQTESKSAKKVMPPPALPGPGPDGILVFGRREDRDRSLEENVKVLREIDSVIDRFAEELEDIQRR
ncbi:MAG: DivIVA domain-containing protein [Candidatus Zixiibacteriota bacterium]